ncbi:adenine deaminase [Arthrobacter sp. Hiyo8]|nr:adenine deaminase [Arthrobacter sp. Hiyo8]
MTTTPPGTLTIRNALIFDGETRNLIEGSITVREGRITEVGRDVEEAGKIVDADGRTVIPGLIDAHFHAYALSLTAAKNETGPLSYSALAGARRLGAALNRGFTSVRDVAGET